jgi:hypothetical protein
MKISKMLIISAAFIIMLQACKPSTEPAQKTDSTVTTQVAEQKPVYAYPIKYTEWEIGNRDYVKTVIDCYKAWDEGDTSKLKSFFADTVILRLPNDTRQVEIPKSKIAETIKANKAAYASTSNNIISAVSLHDRESKEDWVMVMTYNKWTEKNGTRDSILLHEDWLIKDGKLKMLMSFTKTPTKTFLKNNDSPAKNN